MDKHRPWPKPEKRYISEEEHERLFNPYAQQQEFLGWLEACSEKAASILVEYGCTTIVNYGTKSMFPQGKGLKRWVAPDIWVPPLDVPTFLREEDGKLVADENPEKITELEYPYKIRVNPDITLKKIGEINGTEKDFDKAEQAAEILDLIAGVWEASSTGDPWVLANAATTLGSMAFQYGAELEMPPMANLRELGRQSSNKGYISDIKQYVETLHDGLTLIEMTAGEAADEIFDALHDGKEEVQDCFRYGEEPVIIIEKTDESTKTISYRNLAKKSDGIKKLPRDRLKTYIQEIRRKRKKSIPAVMK